MYPTNVVEFSALAAALLPLLIWSMSALGSTWTKAGQNRVERWRRLNEVAQALYNREHVAGAWVQFAAADELADFGGHHRRASLRIARSAKQHFIDNEALSTVLLATIQTLERRS